MTRTSTPPKQATESGLRPDCLPFSDVFAQSIATIDVTAAAYGGKGSQFFRYGPRFVPERENRGRRLPRRR